MGKEKLLPICAIAVLLIGCLSSLYVNGIEIYSNTIKINNDEYTMDEIFSLAKTRTIITDDGEKTGLALDDLIISAGYTCISCNVYTFKSKDGYQQTLTGDYLQKGVLTKDNRVFFSNTAHAFWVKNIVEIEVGK